MPNNEWGDFQTPPPLAQRVVATLPDGPWARVLEPTCGRGTFLTAAAGLNAERLGVEINPTYAEVAASGGACVVRGDLFALDLATDLPWRSDGPLLVIGNPPWVTTAQLGRLGSINLPPRSNVRNLRGLDALTGASNFDIAEFIVVKLMVELAAQRPTIAMLVKAQVARNVLRHAAQFGLPYGGFTIRRIDAKAWFGAAVDACLFTVAYSDRPEYVCAVHPSLEGVAPERTIGVVDGRLVADLGAYRRAASVDGRGPLAWRSGVKHDAAAVMELSAAARQEHGLEERYVFPLLKGTDVVRGRAPRRYLVVPQRRLGEDTAHLERDAPALWAYLTAHAAALDGRRSAVYRGRPRFSVFGLGAYTFAPYKIAVSGLHEEVRFALVGPYGGRPVVVDDTCYLLAFDDGAEAALCHALLTGGDATALLESLIFRDAKRPVTKTLLQRLDLVALAHRPDPDLHGRATAAARGAGIAVPPDWDAVRDRLLATWATP